MNNLFDANIHNRSHKAKKTNSCTWHIKSNFLVFVLVVFVAIAARQAFVLSNMLSEAKAISKDISCIRTGQEILLKQYASYDNNLSYFLNNY